MSHIVLLHVAPLTQPRSRAVRDALMADPLQFCVPIDFSLRQRPARFSASPSTILLNGFALLRPAFVRHGPTSHFRFPHYDSWRLYYGPVMCKRQRLPA
ncbi:hypothetical protein BU25DRAFT_112865 [Macroventuria anomochaeta]|uniref:Uncharacterized protein n=1 Tax=Macroventuria anomochaeta TaxID=301207 RepID=A0ACB6RTY8_9PLEO|nr:uncharacterized protein BU25DRAFT_112865 [Macroventuria anomochaeta]KAF2625455.1 hypothetical protein BU25DRAFT_112865 [Macroventuria anomochaeta]